MNYFFNITIKIKHFLNLKNLQLIKMNYLTAMHSSTQQLFAHTLDLGLVGSYKLNPPTGKEHVM